MARPRDDSDEKRQLRKAYETPGSPSGRKLAKRFGFSESAVRKWAKEEGWKKGRRRASVHVQPERRTPTEAPAAPLDGQPQDALVERGRGLAARMLDELDAMTLSVGELRTLIDTAAGDEDQEKALRQALTLKNRAEVLKTIALTAKTLNDAGALDGGKKASRLRSAKEVGRAGKYAPRTPPRLVVDNGAA